MYADKHTSSNVYTYRDIYPHIITLKNYLIMIDPKIRKEILRLTLLQLEANIESRYYSEQITRILTDSYEKHEELNKIQDVENLTENERHDLRYKVRRAQIESRACKEITTFIERQIDKVNRKANETEQRMAAFCKRHGIEDLDAYLKAEMQEEKNTHNLGK